MYLIMSSLSSRSVPARTSNLAVWTLEKVFDKPINQFEIKGLSGMWRKARSARRAHKTQYGAVEHKAVLHLHPVPDETSKYLEAEDCKSNCLK